jgi:hypothetical protein
MAGWLWWCVAYMGIRGGRASPVRGALIRRVGMAVGGLQELGGDRGGIAGGFEVSASSKGAVYRGLSGYSSTLSRSGCYCGVGRRRRGSARAPSRQPPAANRQPPTAKAGDCRLDLSTTATTATISRPAIPRHPRRTPFVTSAPAPAPVPLLLPLLPLPPPWPMCFRPRNGSSTSTRRLRPSPRTPPCPTRQATRPR